MAAGDVVRLPLHTCELKTAEKGSRCTTFDITFERKIEQEAVRAISVAGAEPKDEEVAGLGIKCVHDEPFGIYRRENAK